MKTTPSSSPETIANSGIGSPQEISKKILGILSGDERELLAEKNLLFQGLLDELKGVISQKRDEIGYDYSDYQTRLYQSQETLEKVFEKRVLSDTKIQEALERLLSLGEDETQKSILKSRLMQDCFLDLIYDSMEESDQRSPYKDTLESHRYQKANQTEKIQILQQLQNDTSIYIHPTTYDSESLRLLFSYMKNVKMIHLGYHLWELNHEDIGYIFQSLTHVKEIKHLSDYLRNIDEQNFQLLAPGLKSLKRVSLQQIDFGKMSLPLIRSLFESLESMESVNFYECDLGHLDHERLALIFGSLKNIKDLDLGKNNLGALSIQGLGIIFESVPNLISLNLTNNEVGSFSEEALSAVFTPLTHLRKLISFNDNTILWGRMKQRFPHLKNTKFIYS